MHVEVEMDKIVEEGEVVDVQELDDYLLGLLFGVVVEWQSVMSLERNLGIYLLLKHFVPFLWRSDNLHLPILDSRCCD